MIGGLYGRRDPLGECSDDVVASAYLFGPVLQLPLEKRYAVAQVGNDLVFGFQQECLRARLLAANLVRGRRGRFAATLCHLVVALRLCGRLAQFFLSADFLRSRDVLGS
jgi:hypothetical protein